MNEKRIYKLNYVPLLLVVMIMSVSCELLDDAGGVVPIEVSLILTDSQPVNNGDLPVLEELNLKVNSMALGYSPTELFYLSPNETGVQLTSSNNSSVLLSDYIPRDSFRNFDMRIGNSPSDSDASEISQVFISGSYNEQPFALSLLDTLHVLYEFASPLDVLNNPKASVYIDIIVDQSGWFLSETGSVLDPTNTVNADQIYQNIQESISIEYEVGKDHCPKEECGNSNNGKDTSALIEVTGDENSEAEDSLLFKVILSEPLEDSVRVTYSTSDNSAKENVDYIPLNDEIIFLPGEIQKFILVSIIDDTIKESDERFSLEIMGVSGANLNKSQSKVQGIILNDDETSKGNSGGNDKGNGGGNGDNGGQGNGNGNGGQGNGEGNGGQGNGDGNGNGGGNGEDNGSGQGSGNGNSGEGNGGHGNGDGNGGQGNGDGNGGQENGNGNGGQGNGDGNGGQGNGDGNGGQGNGEGNGGQGNGDGNGGQGNGDGNGGQGNGDGNGGQGNGEGNDGQGNGEGNGGQGNGDGKGGDGNGGEGNGGQGNGNGQGSGNGPLKI